MLFRGKKSFTNCHGAFATSQTDILISHNVNFKHTKTISIEPQMYAFATFIPCLSSQCRPKVASPFHLPNNTARLVWLKDTLYSHSNLRPYVDQGHKHRKRSKSIHVASLTESYELNQREISNMSFPWWSKGSGNSLEEKLRRWWFTLPSLVCLLKAFPTPNTYSIWNWISPSFKTQHEGEGTFSDS